MGSRPMERNTKMHRMIILFIVQSQKMKIFNYKTFFFLLSVPLSYGSLLNAVPEISIPTPRKASGRSEGEGGGETR